MRVATTYQEYVSLHHYTTRLCQFVCRNKTQTTYQEYVSLHHFTTRLCQFVCRNKTQTTYQEYVSLHHYTTLLCQFVCRNKTQTTYQEYVSLHHYTTLLCQFVCRNKTQTMAQSRGFPKMIGQNRKLSVNPNMKLMTKSMPRISFVKGERWMRANSRVAWINAVCWKHFIPATGGWNYICKYDGM